jgi:hypothetical protein
VIKSEIILYFSDWRNVLFFLVARFFLIIFSCSLILAVRRIWPRSFTSRDFSVSRDFILSSFTFLLSTSLIGPLGLLDGDRMEERLEEIETSKSYEVSSM